MISTTETVTVELSRSVYNLLTSVIAEVVLGEIDNAGLALAESIHISLYHKDQDAIDDIVYAHADSIDTIHELIAAYKEFDPELVALHSHIETFEDDDDAVNKAIPPQQNAASPIFQQ